MGMTCLRSATGNGEEPSRPSLRRQRLRQIMCKATPLPDRQMSPKSAHRGAPSPEPGRDRDPCDIDAFLQLPAKNPPDDRNVSACKCCRSLWSHDAKRSSLQNRAGHRLRNRDENVIWSKGYENELVMRSGSEDNGQPARTRGFLVICSVSLRRMLCTRLLAAHNQHTPACQNSVVWLSQGSASSSPEGRNARAGLSESQAASCMSSGSVLVI
jgi:hypothetical protein